MAAVSDGYTDVLERPLYAHLATTWPDGTAQVNPMWFDWDGERLRFRLTTKRQKYRNVNSHSQVAASIATSSDASSRFVRSHCMKLGQLPAQILWTRAISLGVVGVGDMASQMIPHLVGALS